MDDTIIADDSVSEGAWRIACRRFAGQVGSLDPEELYAGIWETASWYWEDEDRSQSGRFDLNKTRREIVRLAFSRLGVKTDCIADALADTYSEAKSQAIAPIPGAVQTLNRLKNQGLKLALVTNGGAEPQRRKIERFGLAKLFDFILIEGEFGVGKPDEMVYRSTLEALKVQPSQSWMVGDDLNRDIAGAQRLGIGGVWVDWRGNGLPLTSQVRPEFTVRTLSQLFDLK
jgi:putative hydrolase of the HAD superfamily